MERLNRIEQIEEALTEHDWDWAEVQLSKGKILTYGNGFYRLRFRSGGLEYAYHKTQTNWVRLTDTSNWKRKHRNDYRIVDE